MQYFSTILEMHQGKHINLLFKLFYKVCNFYIAEINKYTDKVCVLRTAYSQFYKKMGKLKIFYFNSFEYEMLRRFEMLKC